MCGIAGFIGEASGPFLTSLRERALALMECRGPDGCGAAVLAGSGFADAGVGDVSGGRTIMLVHRRLAVLDRTNAGAQPMYSDDGRFALTYNGEVYNFGSLRAMMGHGSPSYRGTSDSEVVLRWLADGRGANAFTGMFALAIADARSGRLTLLRDAYGIKPLFVARTRFGVAFASDPRVLLGLDGVGGQVDEIRVTEFLRYGAVSSSSTRTAYRDIEQLLPGTGLHIDLATGGVEEFRWLEPSSTRPYSGSFKQAAQAIRESFVESVRLHLKSDVRVGCALSGGIDSSAIACTMRLILGNAAHIHAVSHIANEATYSEEKWIDVAAAAAKAIVHKVRPEPGELPRDLDDLIRAQGEPIAGTSLYAQYRVFAAAQSAGLTVMLDGQGADELLAGYSYYRVYLARERLSKGDWMSAWRALRGGNARRVLPPLVVPMLAARTFLPVRLADRLGSVVGRPALPDWIRLHEADKYYREQERHRFNRTVGLQAALQDTMITSLQGLLRFEDRNSMRFSIESRVPFLERNLVELIQSMPAEYLIGPQGQTKYVFREAMRGIVPDAILDRTDKVGFENDEARWLLACRTWADEVIAASDAGSPIVDARRLHVAWQAFVERPTAPAARRLWATLLFLRWRQLTPPTT